MKHRWIWIILIIILAIVIWKVVVAKPEAGDNQRRPGGMMQAIPVELAPVEIRDMVERSTFSGSLEAKHKFLVAPKVSGQLQKLHVNIGQRVRKGDLLAQLDDRLMQQEYLRANAAVEVARANAGQAELSLELAFTELERTRELVERSYISQSEFDHANSQYAGALAQDSIAKATLNSALAALNTAELQLSFAKITADWSDDAEYRVIGERFAEEGSQLSAGTPIVSLMDISSVIAVLDVIEQDYNRVKIGQNATIYSDSYPDQSFTGKVLRIAPVLQESSRQARIEIEVPNIQAMLKPGMFVRVAISFQTKAGVQAVDERALSKLRGEQGVFLHDPESATVNFIAVKTGISSQGHVEIVDPPLSGEVVVLGQYMLDDGRKVTVQGRGEK